MGDMFSLVTPLLLHMLVSEAVVLFFGSGLDSSSCTVIAAAVVLPAAIRMYRKDTMRDAGQTSSVQKNSEVQNNHVVQNRNEVQSDSAAQGLAYEEKDVFTQSRRKWHPAIFGLCCFIAGGILNILWSGILNALHISRYFSNATQEALLSGKMLVQVLGLGILIPIAEELIFRGLIYRRMRRFFSVKIAVFLSALLFAVYHGNLIQMIFAFPMALTLALIFEGGKLFLFPVLFHMGVNLTAVFLNFFL